MPVQALSSLRFSGDHVLVPDVISYSERFKVILTFQNPGQEDLVSSLLPSLEPLKSPMPQEGTAISVPANPPQTQNMQKLT